MIRSRRMHLVSTGNDVNEVLAEAMEFAEKSKLSDKDALRIRLLTEETMAMLRIMTGEVELALEFVEKNGICTIILETDTLMDVMKKNTLLSVSKSGKNTSAVGVLGKIRDVFETAFLMPADGNWADYCTPSMLIGTPGDLNAAQYMDTMYWSLSTYRDNVNEKSREEDYSRKWDELEKSIISNIADDVQIGIRSGHVIMSIVYKPAK